MPRCSRASACISRNSRKDRQGLLFQIQGSVDGGLYTSSSLSSSSSSSIPRVFAIDRGRDGALACTTPPSETGQAVLPHPSLQSRVLPTSGLTGVRMGCEFRVQPLFRKIGFGPASLILQFRHAFRTRPPSQLLFSSSLNSVAQEFKVCSMFLHINDPGFLRMKG